MSAWGGVDLFFALSRRTPRGTSYCEAAAKYLPLVLLALAAEMLYFHGLDNQNNTVLLVSIPLFAIGATLFIQKTFHPGSFSRRVMDLAVLRFYGRYSYGLYFYHYLLRNVLKNVLYFRLTSRIPNPTIAGVLYLVCCVVLLTAVSVASFHL